MLFRSEEGVVAGGGTTLIRAQAEVMDMIDKIEDREEQVGARIVAKSLEGPLNQIAINAGMEGGVVVEKVRNLEGSVGLNAATGELETILVLENSLEEWMDVLKQPTRLKDAVEEAKRMG